MATTALQQKLGQGRSKSRLKGACGTARPIKGVQLFGPGHLVPQSGVCWGASSTVSCSDWALLHR